MISSSFIRLEEDGELGGGGGIDQFTHLMSADRETNKE